MAETQLEIERRRREEAETTLALLREKTKEKFFALKNENEALQKTISELSEQRSNDSDWLGLQDSLRALDHERKVLKEENTTLKHDLASFRGSYDRQLHGPPVHAISSGERLWVITADSRAFETAKQPDFPEPLDEQVEHLSREIADLRERLRTQSDTSKSLKATIELLETSRPPSRKPALVLEREFSVTCISRVEEPDSPVFERRLKSPWIFERERLEKLLDQLEDSLEEERRKTRDLDDELTELRRRLRTHEENSSLTSADDTKILYAKNVFSKLFALAPRGCPEFEQLLLVLCAFFNVPLDEAAEQRRLRLDGPGKSRGVFPF